mmetsp:Transcript_98832/g.213304  ORF Transcript_98832/g.213304 Transcript_98832/m.213304 type:complete len:83 (+) Transcript_98832:114-362(+)
MLVDTADDEKGCSMLPHSCSSVALPPSVGLVGLVGLVLVLLVSTIQDAGSAGTTPAQASWGPGVAFAAAALPDAFLSQGTPA